MKTTQFPLIPKALLEALEKRFPDQMPDSKLSADEIRIKQGEVNVVRYLRHEYDKQTKTILEG